MGVHITAEFTAGQAAALAGLCKKFARGDGKGYLSPHISAEDREEQGYQMVDARVMVHDELREAGVWTWPRIDTGVAS